LQLFFVKFRSVCRSTISPSPSIIIFHFLIIILNPFMAKLDPSVIRASSALAFWLTDRYRRHFPAEPPNSALTFYFG
jgi:hypothetical protein